MTTAASLDSTEVRLGPGDVIAIPLEIQNNGELVEGYRIDVVGPPAAWAEVEPPSLSLYPGTTATATVTFRPPRSSTVPAGEQRFGVVVTPTDHPDDAVVPEGVIDVLPFLDTVAELVPRTSQGRNGGRHQLAVDNRGNVPVTTLFEGYDDANLLDVKAVPPGVTVAPGEAVFVDLRVRPLQRVWRGAASTHPFQVVVSAQDSTPLTLDGTYVQQPTVPAWLPKLLLALLALLLALLALWFWVFKPTIEAAAREAVAEEVGAAQEAAEQAADDAEEAAEQAEDQATEAQKQASAVDEQVPGVENDVQRVETIRTEIEKLSGALQPSTPFATRLSPEDDSGGVYTVPDEQTLEITDLVFSNPQGDFGRAQLLVSGESMFDIALENFRDLDYHFVTPIEAPAGDAVELNVTCRTPGQPPDADAATACDISMYLGGSLVDLPPEPEAESAAE